MNNLTERDVLLILVGALDHQKNHSLVRLAKHVLKIPEDKYLQPKKLKQEDLPPPFNDVDIDKLVSETFKRDLGI